MTIHYLYKQGRSIARIEISDSFIARLVGLLGRAELADDQGMLLTRCRAVHTIGMRFPLDIVFLDSSMRIRRVASQVVPWRFVSERSADRVLELSSGAARKFGLRAGDQLILEQS